MRFLAVLVVACVQAACAANPGPSVLPSAVTRQVTATMQLHGKPLDLHLSRPAEPAATDVLILYASGDGGWFGTAVDMFRQIAGDGYYAVGFSSRAFLRIERPRGELDARQLSAEYEQILTHARSALGMSATSRAILTGWSRGAAFAVIVGSEPVMRPGLRGVVAIGLSDGEDLKVSGPDDETDDGQAIEDGQRLPFQPYARIRHLGEVPCAVIQASRDNYLPAPRARQLFGPDTDLRRFYAVEARNHRFTGGRQAFDRTLHAALDWIVSRPGTGK